MCLEIISLWCGGEEVHQRKCTRPSSFLGRVQLELRMTCQFLKLVRWECTKLKIISTTNEGTLPALQILKCSTNDLLQ